MMHSISSKSIIKSVINNADEVNYLELFLKEEQEQRNKYIISQNNLEVIDMIDQILMQKNQQLKKERTTPKK